MTGIHFGWKCTLGFEGMGILKDLRKGDTMMIVDRCEKGLGGTIRSVNGKHRVPAEMIFDFGDGLR